MFKDSIEPKNEVEIEATPEFKKWFEGSVVVNDKKEPLPVYHTSLKKNFDGLHLKPGDAEDWRSFGVYFSSDKNSTIKYYSQEYSDSVNRYNSLLSQDISEKFVIDKEKRKYLNEFEDQPKTFTCYLSIKNPLILHNHDELMKLYFSGVTKEELKEKYDGIIIKYDNDFLDQYIAFDSNQIKILPSKII